MLAVAASLLLAGCGTPTEPTPLTASVAHSRAGSARGLVNVLLASSADEPVQVRTLAIADQRFAPVPATERLVTVPAGADRLLVPVALGAGRCTGVLGTPVLLADGEPVAIDAAGRALLDRMEDDACDRALVARSATVSLVDADVVTPTAVDVLLRVARERGAAAVTVDDVGSNVIFTVTSGDLPSTLSAEDDIVEVTVRFAADRCEPHAVAESKKTFQFPMWLALDGGEPQFVELAATGDVRDALGAAFDACAEAQRR